MNNGLEIISNVLYRVFLSDNIILMIHFKPDKWTAVTADGKRSAQFEQTLLVTETGCEILTKRRDHDGRPWFMDRL